ncbi:MAG: M28 family peptidase [Planctomycetaceae bacterium]|nr:M28 family peptidase [Planctomycetaceae bacterium]
MLIQLSTVQYFLQLGLMITCLAVLDDPAAAEEPVSPDSKDAAEQESQLLSGARQLTFEGRRAGEGYFSQDGSKMVFQSERDASNPFFQIYLLDFETGDVDRVSPGEGKTTCGWIHPGGEEVLFASTHEDEAAVRKQKKELEFRESGKERRYSWDYDENYDLFTYDTNTEKYKNLTSTKGYDAEASWSPDGKLIAFASNRNAYQKDLSPTQRQRFEMDPSSMIDLYVMDADGGNVRQLTDVEGYDGGPFFSHDGQRICWRRFSPDGATAEIMSMNTEGGDIQTLTRLGAMSWAPYYHPSGQYLIFATNVHGFGNFELYLVDSEGKQDPIRVTYTDGFDGLPVFTPNGKQLAWTTNRTRGKQSQIFLANWDHDAALERLGLSSHHSISTAESVAANAAADSSRSTTSTCNPEDILRHVGYLCRPELNGRRTGTRGERLATAYVAAYMDQLDLRPSGDNGGWFQNFEFASGVALGDANQLKTGNRSYQLEKDWTPLGFSKVGPVKDAPIVFAGYGIVAPSSNDHAEYDSFVHLDVKDKWIMVFRFMPEDISAERRQHLASHSSLRFKAMTARERGARGLIVVSGPNSGVKNQLASFRFDGSLAGSGLPVISISDQVADSWLKSTGKSLKDLQTKLDRGEPQMGFELKELQVAANIDIEQIEHQGRNVLGRLQAGDQPSQQVVIVGAHIDHLGSGPSSSSLARDDEQQGVHWGADDNASGVAAMLEVAQWLSSLKKANKLPIKRDIIFAAWSGEEEGLIGSSHFAKTFQPPSHNPHATHPHATHPHATTKANASSEHPHASPDEASLYPTIAACINMDMVGRLDKKLILQGVGSSSVWKGEIERRNAVTGLPITIQNDSFIPTDASTFFVRGVPILSAFTGSHEDYHTPRDTPDKLNYEGNARIAKFMGLVTRSIASRDDAPDYVSQERPKETRANLRAYLGTIPDYAESDVKGLQISGVAKKGPAALAGLKGGDVIVELAGRKIENIYDYTYAIEALKIGQPTKIVVQRKGKRLKLEITPGSRN